jgi:hypothetical protein
MTAKQGSIAAANPPKSNPGTTVSPGIAMPCSMQKTSVSTVNGQKQGTVFTPDPAYNLYTIKGCNFGDKQGDAHLYGGFAAGQIKLQVNFWSDEQIVAQVDPNVSGEKDRDNVSLVIVPANGPQTQAPGFKFYAARETMLLKSVPQSMVTLGPGKDIKGRDLIPTFTSPSSSYNSQGASVEVLRYVSDTGFGTTKDRYDLSRLPQGYVADSFQMATQSLITSRCGPGSTYYNDYPFSAAWVGDAIQVTAGEDHCHEPGSSFPPPVPDWDFGGSYYTLNIWIVGPRGLQPW